MAVAMTFYSNFSKRENSTKQPTGGTSYNVVFKEGFSVIGGTVKLQVNFDTAKNFTAANYENRYYKVDNVVSINNDIVDIILSLDALATYRSNIAAYRGLITRCPSGNVDTNNVYKDDKIQPLSDYIVREKTIHLVNISNNLCYQVRFKSTHLNEIYFMTPAALTDLVDQLDGILSTLLSLGEAVESILAVPISIDKIVGQNTNTVYCNTTELQINSGTVVRVTLPGSVTLSTGIIDFTNTYFKYTDFKKYDEDFTKLAVVYNGTSTNIPTGVLRGNLQYSLEMDIFSLDTRFEITLWTEEGRGDSLIYSSVGNLGIPYSIGFGNALYNSLKIATLVASRGATGAAQEITATQIKTIDRKTNHKKPEATITYSKDSYQGDFLSSGAMASGGVLTDLSDVTRTSTVPATTSSYFSWWLLTEFSIAITEYSSSPASVDENGYPVLAVTNINHFNSNGFYKFDNPNLEISAIQSIRVLINNALANGIYYE